jgi:hypothetical protein
MAKKTTPGTVAANTQQPDAKAKAKSSAPGSAKTAGKQRGKPAGKKPATPAAVKESKREAATKASKRSKPKKVKMVRDSYTMPEDDYAKLAELKKKCLKAGVHVKKSELLRAGLTTLAKLPVATLLKTVDQLEKIKTGRPGKH